MIKKKAIVYKDFTKETENIAKVKMWLEGRIEFEVEVNKKNYHCSLFKEDIWRVTIPQIRTDIELAQLDDTFWNASAIWYYTKDTDISSAISEAIKEIYTCAKGILK